MNVVFKNTRDRVLAFIVGVVLVVASLFTAQAINPSEKANAYYNWVWNNTGSFIKMESLSGYTWSVGDYGIDVRAVYVPWNKCFRFYGPGTNFKYCALRSQKVFLGPGTWWVYKA